MRFRTHSHLSAFAALGVSILASSAMAQRVAAPLHPAAAQSAQKLPAPPPPVQAPMTRDTRGRKAHPLQPVKARLPDARESKSRVPHDQLYFATGSDGAPQVRGRTYKAEFAADAASYTPFCGSAAPRSHPLSFRIQSISAGGEPVAFATDVAAQRAGNSVGFARGGVRELYELGLDSIDQKFVFDTLPATGELVVRIACASDMTAAYADGGIQFSSADGSVRYGAATVVDAQGASAPAQLDLDGQGIGIHVSAEFLATAAFPITIDPLITTFAVFWNSTSTDDFAPAVSWDESNQRYCTVFEQVFSATDHDMVYVFSDPAGFFLGAGYIDVSSDYWAAPDVANNNNANNFYVVAAVGDPAGGVRTIRGKTLDAATGATGVDTEISVGTLGEDILPSVGGDPFGSNAAYYTVVWERIFNPGVDTDILCQQVDQAGALLNSIISIDNSSGSLDGSPRISKSCLAFGIHHVVWQRDVAPGDSDVYAAEVAWDGTVSIGSTPIVTGGNTTAPACSPMDNGNNWLLVYEYDFITDHDVYGAHMTGVTVNNTLNLSDRGQPVRGPGASGGRHRRRALLVQLLGVVLEQPDRLRHLRLLARLHRQLPQDRRVPCEPGLQHLARGLPAHVLAADERRLGQPHGHRLVRRHGRVRPARRRCRGLRDGRLHQDVLGRLGRGGQLPLRQHVVPARPRLRQQQRDGRRLARRFR
jgi:hypothetical protein